MSDYSLIIRNSKVVLKDSVVTADIGVIGEFIRSIQPSIKGTCDMEYDASGLVTMPGFIDSHVHFNDPGRTHWEGSYTGSRAFALGGGTTFFDMPLNSIPPTITSEGFDSKLAVLQENSLIDFCLWGGLVPGNIHHLERLKKKGVIGLKAFMSSSGVEEFSSVDDRTLLEGMREAARLGMIVALHAEDDELTSRLTANAMKAGRHSVRDYLESRPIIAETLAIKKAIKFCEETGCKLHIVHVSSGEGAVLLLEAKLKGLPITFETCPHYLLYTSTDVEKVGALLKCAPPIRDESEKQRIWTNIVNRDIDFISSDHSPAPMNMKESNNFFDVWGGIPGCQHAFISFLDEALKCHGITLDKLSCLLSTNAAQTYNISHLKGSLEVGKHADITILELKHPYVVSDENLLYKNKISPYVGRSLNSKIKATFLRGYSLYDSTEKFRNVHGQLVTPLEAPSSN